MPDTRVVSGTRMHLNGIGLRTFSILGIRIYVAGLYLERRSGDPDTILQSPEAKLLDIRFLRDVDAEDARKAWQESFEQNCKAPCSLDPHDMQRFLAAVPSVRKGDDFHSAFHLEGCSHHLKRATDGRHRRSALRRVDARHIHRRRAADATVEAGATRSPGLTSQVFCPHAADLRSRPRRRHLALSISPAPARRPPSVGMESWQASTRHLALGAVIPAKSDAKSGGPVAAWLPAFRGDDSRGTRSGQPSAAGAVTDAIAEDRIGSEAHDAITIT